jgi:predicted GH43/DUF377 family glycosyl hydrolase
MTTLSDHSEGILPPEVTVRRISDEPVVAYGTVEGYGPIFNAGAVFHAGRFHLFARAVRDCYRRNEGPGPRFVDYVSDILVFVSDDGRAYEFQQKLAEASSTGVWCFEDPRVQAVRSNGEEHFVMTYTNLPPHEHGLPWRIGIHRLEYGDGRFSLDAESGRVIGPEDHPNKDAIVFNLRDGRVALIHRIYPNMQLAVFDSLEQLWDPPAAYWDEYLLDLNRHVIIEPDPGSFGVGAGAPPVETPDGLLLLYHERGWDGHYVTKAALLDHDTGRLKARLAEPIMRPDLPWEREGDVDNVVFVQGAILQPDGQIYMTYGAADRSVGAALVSIDELLDALRSNAASTRVAA